MGDDATRRLLNVSWRSLARRTKDSVNTVDRIGEAVKEYDNGRFLSPNNDAGACVAYGVCKAKNCHMASGF